MWSVYYSDDTVAASAEYTPFELPRRTDVQVIVQDNVNHGWVTRCGHDFYVWDDRGGGWRWWNATYSGLMQYLMKPGRKCVLFGYEIDKAQYNAIFNRARAEFGEKNGYENTERIP